MKQWIVQMVGESRTQLVEAHSSMLAVAEAACCNWRAVCLPIWRREPSWGRGLTTYNEECFMPLDNSGRQWIVRPT